MRAPPEQDAYLFQRKSTTVVERFRHDLAACCEYMEKVFNGGDWSPTALNKADTLLSLSR
jgi:hypothetical protein